MNKDEFNQLEQDIGYRDAVEVVGGAVTGIEKSVYEWRDEILLTQAHLLFFKDGKLITTEIIEKRGSSSR